MGNLCCSSASGGTRRAQSSAHPAGRPARSRPPGRPTPPPGYWSPMPNITRKPRSTSYNPTHVRRRPISDFPSESESYYYASTSPTSHHPFSLASHNYSSPSSSSHSSASTVRPHPTRPPPTQHRPTGPVTNTRTSINVRQQLRSSQPQHAGPSIPQPVDASAEKRDNLGDTENDAPLKVKGYDLWVYWRKRRSGGLGNVNIVGKMGKSNALHGRGKKVTKAQAEALVERTRVDEIGTST